MRAERLEQRLTRSSCRCGTLHLEETVCLESLGLPDDLLDTRPSERGEHSLMIRIEWQDVAIRDGLCASPLSPDRPSDLEPRDFSLRA